MRRLPGAPSRSWEGAGFAGGEAEATIAVHQGPPKARPARFGLGREASGGVGLPDLDEGVGNRGAGAVHDATDQGHRPVGRLGHQVAGVHPRHAETEERPDGLRGCGRNRLIGHGRPRWAPTTTSKR